MLASAIIAKKRDCGELTRDEIAFMIEGFVKDTVKDYQMSHGPWQFFAEA